MKNYPKLLKEDINAVLDSYKNYQKRLGLIKDRVDYIVKFIFQEIKAKLDFWDWVPNDCEKDNTANFFESYNERDLFFKINVGFSKYPYNTSYFGKDGKEYKLDFLNDGFPIRWLWEDFEEEFINGFKAAQKKKDQEKQKLEEEKSKKRELVKTALSKLTNKEKEALSLNDFLH